MELGLATFADLAGGVEPAQRMRELIEEAELADQLGLDVFAIGEHHRPDFLVSSPAVVLAAVAMRTERIRLSSAVTVLSSDDPVRVFQDFAQLDLLSGGRAEIMAGRGSFTESFPLFGYDLDDYDELYAEKLDLLLKIRDSEHVTWSGRLRPSLLDAGVWPRPLQGKLPIWVAVGGSPPSVVRAGTLGLPLTIAIIGGQPARFAPLVELYRASARSAQHDPLEMPVAINTHAFVGASTAQADAAFAAPYLAMMNRIDNSKGEFSDEVLTPFLKRVCPEMAPLKQFYVNELWLEGAPAAWLLVIPSDLGPMIYNTTYDADKQKLSPGAVSFGMAIRDAIAEGYPSFNLLRGGEEYKRRMGAIDADLFRITLTRV